MNRKDDHTSQHVAIVGGLSVVLAIYGLGIGFLSVGMNKTVEPWWFGFIMVGIIGFLTSRVLKSLAQTKDDHPKS